MKRLIGATAVVGAATILFAGCSSNPQPNTATWGYANTAAYRSNQATAATGAPLKHTYPAMTTGGGVDDQENLALGRRETQPVEAAQVNPTQPPAVNQGYGINTQNQVGTPVVDAHGRIIGSVSDSYGTVVDASGNQIGHVSNPAGNVVDLQGYTIGHVQPSPTTPP